MRKQSTESIYARAAMYAEMTKKLIANGKTQRAKRCLRIAEQLLKSGSSEVRIAVSNVYMFSLTRFMELHNCSIKGLFPEVLKQEYYKQVNTSGI